MEYTLRSVLAAHGQSQVSIGSAGTRALRGHPMAEPLSQRIRARGEDPSDFRASALRPEELESAGLVVTATREHRRQVVLLRHDVADRAFTLAQLARLLSAASLDTSPAIGSVPELVIAAHAARGRTPAGSSTEDDLEDPWQRSRRTYRRVADRIDRLLVPLTARLVGGR